MLLYSMLVLVSHMLRHSDHVHDVSNRKVMATLWSKSIFSCSAECNWPYAHTVT